MKMYDFLEDSEFIDVTNVDEKITELLYESDDFDEDVFNSSDIKKITINSSKLILSNTYFDGGVEISSKTLLTDNLENTLSCGTFISTGYLYEKEDKTKPAYAVININDNEEITHVIIELN